MTEHFGIIGNILLSLGIIAIAIVGIRATVLRRARNAGPKTGGGSWDGPGDGPINDA
jgi:hypothetical protein